MTPHRVRFAEVVRSEPVALGLACLLVGGEVEPDLDVDVSLQALDTLAAAVRRRVPRGASPAAAAEGLRVVLGDEAGFAGSAQDYDDLRASLLHEVLRRKRGLPLLLSVVWLEVAARLELPAYALALPGHVVVGIGDPEGEHVLVDPFSGGGPLSRQVVASTVAAAGWGPQDPRVLTPADVLLRLLTNIRVLTSRRSPALQVSATRLWAVELSLLLPRHPVELRRERGELLVRLGDHLGGAQELEMYALVVDDADDDAATAARRDARLARAQLN